MRGTLRQFRQPLAVSRPPPHYMQAQKKMSETQGAGAVRLHPVSDGVSWPGRCINDRYACLRDVREPRGLGKTFLAGPHSRPMSDTRVDPLPTDPSSDYDVSICGWPSRVNRRLAHVGIRDVPVT